MFITVLCLFCTLPRIIQEVPRTAGAALKVFSFVCNLINTIAFLKKNTFMLADSCSKSCHVNNAPTTVNIPRHVGHARTMINALQPAHLASDRQDSPWLDTSEPFETSCRRLGTLAGQRVHCTAAGALRHHLVFSYGAISSSSSSAYSSSAGSAAAGWGLPFRYALRSYLGTLFK